MWRHVSKVEREIRKYVQIAIYAEEQSTVFYETNLIKIVPTEEN
jgi:hypothetical protein